MTGEGKAIYVKQWMPGGFMTEDVAVLNVVEPQRGKTYRTVREFIEMARHGDTLIYSVSSHAEAASVIKHFVTIQREYNWEVRVLLVAYAGLNRWCTLYNKIKKEQRRLGPEYRQNKFCKENCELWQMKPLKKELFEPGTRALYLNKIRKRNKRTGNPPLLHHQIRIILNKYSYNVLRKLYGEIAESVDFAHHTMILSEEEESAQYGKPMKYKGCIRALIMRKLIQVIERDSKTGKIKGQHRRSIYGYPTIIVAPHQLLPLLIHFATIYSNRVFVVIDEFDRMLQSKVPRWLAERFTELGKPKEWNWKTVLEEYSKMEKDARSAEAIYAGMIPTIVMLRRELNPVTGKKRVMEVPLITLVDKALRKAKEKGKLKFLAVVGSSIPLLPRPILRYLIEWLYSYFDYVLVYYSIISEPDYSVVFSNNITAYPPSTLFVYGSKEMALKAVYQVLATVSQVRTEIRFNRPVSLEDAERYIHHYCMQYNYVHRPSTFVCISKNRKNGLLFFPVIVGDDAVRALRVVRWNIPKDWIRIGRWYITWLGGRTTRGVTLPRHIKRIVVITMGKAVEVENDEMTERLRYPDFLQLIFRINSRPDVKLGLIPQAVKMMEDTVNWYNRHVEELIGFVTEINKNKTLSLEV